MWKKNKKHCGSLANKTFIYTLYQFYAKDERGWNHRPIPALLAMCLFSGLIHRVPVRSPQNNG